MKIFSITQAKSRLPEMIRSAQCGEIVIITKYNRPVVRIEPVASSPHERRPGSAKGLITYIAPDFKTNSNDSSM